MDLTKGKIADGLRGLGLDRDQSSIVIVHASLRSFGHVVEGAPAVCRALVSTCGTVLFPAATGDHSQLPAPPGLVRPHNAFHSASTWASFDQALEHPVPFSPDLPIDRELGAIPETARQLFPDGQRSRHPLFSYLGVGPQARLLVEAQTLDWPLGPIEALAALGGDVLLLGTGHTSNTTIHLAEQRLGRSRFYRYAKVGARAWAELPNIPGESHRFDEIEPLLTSVTSEIHIGDCLARRVPAAEVLAAADRLIRADPAALLCDAPGCRCEAALDQRLECLAGHPASPKPDGGWGADRLAPAETERRS